MLQGQAAATTKRGPVRRWRRITVACCLLAFSLVVYFKAPWERTRSRNERDERASQECLEKAAHVGKQVEALNALLAVSEGRVQELRDALLQLGNLAATVHVSDPSGHAAGLGREEEGCWRPLPPLTARVRPHRHKMALILPYRERRHQLDAALPELTAFLQGQGRDFDTFILEQSERYRFNRGALLNAAALLLEGSDYDYFCFHDIDTLPTKHGNIQYDYPAGKAPLHLTPPGIHPAANFEDFFGGITLFTPEQLKAVNGYGSEFWGWGREDDNMRLRLQRAERWPAKLPPVPRKSRRYYFRHADHEKAPEVRMRRGSEGQVTSYFEVHPDVPYGDSLIVSSQPGRLDEGASGLNTTRFWVRSWQPYYQLAVKVQVELYCNVTTTPWCQESRSQ